MEDNKATTVTPKTSRIGNDQLITLLQLQIANEFESAYIYYAMSSWCEYNGLFNGSKMFTKFYKEEITHAEKLIDFLQNKNIKALIPAIPRPTNDFSDIGVILLAGFNHEVKVTKQWSTISTIAITKAEHSVYEFASWYNKEQVEEEKKFLDLLQRWNQLKECFKREFLMDTEVFNHYI